MIPFDVTIPPEQRDKNLTEKLIAENAGILNWLIQGDAMWKKKVLEMRMRLVKLMRSIEWIWMRLEHL